MSKALNTISPRSEQIAQRLQLFGKGLFGAEHGWRTRFAKALGISPQQLNDYLTGRRLPGNKMQTRLRLLHCDIHWLMTGETQKHLNEKFESFILRKAKDLRPGDFEILDYLKSLGLDTPEKVKSVCDPQGLAQDVALAMRERLVRYQIRKKGRKK